MKKIIGYASAWTVMPGDTLNVMVSTYGPDRFHANLVRVICGNDDPDLDIYREEEIAAPFAGEYTGREQFTVAGSYVTIPSSRLVAGLGSFTVQVLASFVSMASANSICGVPEASRKLRRL